MTLWTCGDKRYEHGNLSPRFASSGSSILHKLFWMHLSYSIPKIGSEPSVDLRGFAAGKKGLGLAQNLKRHFQIRS